MSTANGKAAANGAAAKVETTSTILPPKSEATVKTLSAKSSADLPPLEDRLHKLDQLFDLQSKYNRLKGSLQKLKDFKLKSDSESSSLILSDDNRNRFETSNPEVIAEVIATLKATTEKKIKDLEPRLTW